MVLEAFDFISDFFHAHGADAHGSDLLYRLFSHDTMSNLNNQQVVADYDSITVLEEVSQEQPPSNAALIEKWDIELQQSINDAQQAINNMPVTTDVEKTYKIYLQNQLDHVSDEEHKVLKNFHYTSHERLQKLSELKQAADSIELHAENPNWNNPYNP
ncbi:MAG: hypothetical protein AAB439_00955 [Patescibacteria group bacterium]